MASKLICPVCEEPVEAGRPNGFGGSTQVDPERLRHRHLDREPLCPVTDGRVGKGVHPALPVRA